MTSLRVAIALYVIVGSMIFSENRRPLFGIMLWSTPMKILNCPLNGPRNISEFVCLGEVKQSPAPGASAAEWADHVFMEKNPAGFVREWWCHIATNYVFIVERDTRTETILDTYPVSRLVRGDDDPGARSVP